MKLEDLNNRQEELEGYLKELSKNILKPEKEKEYADKLLNIYKDNFRHKYSKIYPLLEELEDSGSTEFLINNLQHIQKYVEKTHFENDNQKGGYEKLYIPLLKLIDHINLEVARYSQQEILLQKNKNNQLDMENFSSNLKNAEHQLHNMQNDIKNQQKEYITILGIFNAAIIMTITGGMFFSSSVLNNIGDVSIYRLIFVTCLIAIVLISTLYLMFKFIYDIVENKTNYNEKKKDTIKRTFWEYSPFYVLFFINIIFLIIMAITYICWYIH